MSENINKKIYETKENWAEVVTSKHYRLAMDKLLINKYYEMLSLQNDLGLLPQLHIVNKGIKLLKELKSSNNNNLWLWLTVNPKPKTCMIKFFHLLNKFANRKQFTDYYYVIEQRGKTMKTLGDGFHSHLLLKRNINYKPSVIIKNSKNTFKNITNINNNEIFFYKWCPSNFLADKINYMTEDKGGEKTIKQQYDISFRKKYNLLSLYVPQALRP